MDDIQTLASMIDIPMLVMVLLFLLYRSEKRFSKLLDLLTTDWQRDKQSQHDSAVVERVPTLSPARPRSSTKM